MHIFIRRNAEDDKDDRVFAWEAFQQHSLPTGAPRPSYYIIRLKDRNIGVWVYV